MEWVSDRLPEDGQEVLATTLFGDKRVCTFDATLQAFHSTETHTEVPRVTAWMPVPEAPRLHRELRISILSGEPTLSLRGTTKQPKKRGNTL